MWRTIRALVAQGCSIVLTTHYLEEAEALADRVAVLANGRLIASGSVEAIRALVLRTQITLLQRSTPGRGPAPGRTWSRSTREAHRLQHHRGRRRGGGARLLAADDSRRLDLEVRPAGLAEAFAELTKEAA